MIHKVVPTSDCIFNFFFFINDIILKINAAASSILSQIIIKRNIKIKRINNNTIYN
jgi:hypothetical protein